MTRFLIITGILTLTGCSTANFFQEINSEIAVDNTMVLLNKPYRTFYVQPVEATVLGLQRFEEDLPIGHAIESRFQGRWYDQAIEGEIRNMLESIGLAYDEKEYDLLISFDVEFYSKPAIRGFYESRLMIIVAGGDPNDNAEIFCIESSYKSHQKVSPLNLMEPVRKTLNQLQVFQSPSGGGHSR